MTNMSSRLFLKWGTYLHLALLAIGLAGCRDAEPRKISVNQLQTTPWRSSDSLTYLTVGPTTFAFRDGNHTEVEPYRILPDSQLLLGKDTIELSLNSKGELSLEPTSRAIVEAEAIRLIYATRFVQIAR